MNRLLALTLTLSVVSCERATVHEYEVPRENVPSTWFFKTRGDDALTAAQKPAFVKFLESLRFAGQ